MRPLRLEVNGLTCFRDAVAIDFGALALVAIEGPTGAGKSSLLDAMILALYGVVPRMGAQNLSELIAHGRSGLSVTLDFEVRGQRWRVARTVNRKRPSQAMLSELVEEDGARVEKRRFNGVIEVQKEVRSLLGIDVAAFQQAVILPQGKFQEFLQSTPGDRRKILSELLGFQVYATMRARAAEIANRLGAEVDVLARQLAGDLALANAELIAELELQHGVARSEREVTQSAADGARAKLGEVERVAARCLELNAIDDALVVLQQREAVIVMMDERVARARAVVPVAPLVERVEATAARVEQLTGRVRELAARALAADKALEVALEAARDAEIAAEQIGALRARIALLDEARGRFEQYQELVSRVTSTDAALAGASSAEAKAAAALTKAVKARDDAFGALQRREAEDVPAVAPELLARWEGLRETASRLAATRVVLERETATLEAARQAELKSESALATADVERKRKEHAELQAEDALEAAREGLAAAEHTARVGLVREHLHAGEACPVCEQTVAVVPEAVVGAEVSGLRERLATQRNAVERARAEGERARTRVAEARARTQEATSRVGEIGEQIARTAAAVAADEVVLREVLEDAPAPAPEVRFRLALQALLERAQRRLAHEAALETQRMAHARAVLEHERDASAHSQATARRLELEATIGDARERLAVVEASLAGLGSQDPKKERASLERVIGGLEERRANAIAAASRARESTTQVGAEVKTLEGLRAEAVTEATAACEVLARSGWTADDVREAALTDDELASAEAMVSTHRAARAAKVAERESIVRVLGPLRAGPAEVALARHEVNAATTRALEAAERAAILGERLRQAQQQLERAGGVRLEHETKTRQLQVYRRVSDDLSPKNFQEFLLEEVIADLVRGASERLFGLSGGRYRMAADSSAGFLVIDLDHAGERRSTDTLSGGETFLASLAMALELSEQIRAKAGRVDLDCIFIDEGFGTLDPEALETVTEAVEGLQRPGRLVGIITHVAELARRMPERLIVEKSATGSTVRLVPS